MQELSKLIVFLRDGRGQLLTTRTAIRLLDRPTGNVIAKASGLASEVSRFEFTLTPGSYWLEVRAVRYKPYTSWVSVTQEPEITLLLDLSIAEGKKEEYEDESKRIPGRIDAFAQIRAYPNTEFPPDARQRALEQKRRMLDPDINNALIKFEPLEDPFPIISFGNIGRFVQVYAIQSEGQALLTMPFAQEDLGWVDPASLHIFAVDVQERRFKPMPGAALNIEYGYVQALIEQPGVYGIFGRPRHPLVLRTLELFCQFQTRLLEEQRSPEKVLQKRLCGLILCAPDLQEFPEIKEFGMPIPPGRRAIDLCEYCTRLELPDAGLPECDLPAPGPGPVVVGGCNWTVIGPRNINGRIRTMAAHPTDGNTVFAGSANGGVWVSHDAGQAWVPLMRDESALEIGALAVHLTDPALPAGAVTLYAGTGEATWWPGYAGVGVLKSIDSGVTWTSTGALPAPGNRGFSSIVIDPTTMTNNPATTVVYAAGPNGLYKSSNGGGAWTLILAGDINNVVIDPTNPTILYAAVAFGGIQKYDPVGNVWNNFNTGFPAPFPQLSLIDIGRIAPHKLYAKLDQTVYVFDMVSASWVSLGSHGGTTHVYWNNVLAIDSTNSDIVFAGGIVFERTFDGGATWQMIGGLHADQHALVFDSINHFNVYAGNDGGVYRGAYTSLTDTGTWVKTSDGLILTQYNDIGSSPAGPLVVGGGAQDNGTSRTVGGLTWDYIWINDGGYFVMDPGNPYILYAETQNGGLAKSTNGGASFVGIGAGFPGGPWVTPIVIDPTSPAEPNRVLFAGSNSEVYRSINSGANWVVSSPAMGGSINTIAIAPTSSAVVYAGSGAGQIWRSSDNGATLANWRNITVGTVVGSVTLPGRTIMDVVVHPSNPNIVFVCFSGFNTATPGTPGHVFRGSSIDGGLTWQWTDITANLPNTPVNAIIVRPSDPNTLFIGTDVGVFRTTNGGLNWAPFDNNLPNVVIADLDLNPTDTILRAATYGRGMYQVSLTGSCTDVDVYMRDSLLDTGETQPSPSGMADPTQLGNTVYWWQSPDIKVDAFPYQPVDALFDGVEFDLASAEDVIRNDGGHPNPNRLYVQVHNRGPLPAHNVKVKVLYANASAGLPALPADFWTRYPNDWMAASTWQTVDAAIPFQNIPELLPNTPKVLRWDWTVPPSANEHTCMLAVISADEDPVTRSDAAPNDHLPWVIVPDDKHVTLRNLHVSTGSAPPEQSPPYAAWLDFHNPLDYAQFFDLVLDLSGLPSTVRLSLLLPAMDISGIEATAKQRGFRIDPIRGQEWWATAENLPKGEWRYHVTLDGLRNDPCSGRRSAELRRLLIEGGDKLTAALMILLPDSVKPGSKHFITVIQRNKYRIVGGSTYELRIPPRAVLGQ